MGLPAIRVRVILKAAARVCQISPEHQATLYYGGKIA